MSGDSTPRRLSSERRVYVDTLTRRLTGEGFRLDPEVKLPDYDVDFFAFKVVNDLTPRTSFVVAANFEEPGADILRTFADKAFDAANMYPDRKWNPFQLFPVAVSNSFNEDLKSLAKNFSKLRWTTGGVLISAHLVLAELSSKQIYHNLSRPIIDLWGKRVNADFAEKVLRF